MKNGLDSKDKVYRALREAGEDFVSGQVLGDTLQLSRNAVWKAVGALRKDGYEIEARTNLGYRLKGGEGSFSKEEIRCQLSWLGVSEELPLEFAGKIPSTSIRLKERALFGMPHGSAVIAEQQTMGQGHDESRFDSPKGGIYMSILVRPDLFSFRDIGRLHRFAAVSVRDTLQEVCGLCTEIRQTSDIMLKGEKVCGILTETLSDQERSRVSWAVIGIGMRVFEPAFQERRSLVAADLLKRILKGQETESAS